LLLQGRRKGELPTDLDVDAAVELLFTTVLGLRVRERAGHDLARLATAIDVAIRALGPTPTTPA
jgi:TetR/AcrR family transcriptional repressor of nem operon